MNPVPAAAAIPDYLAGTWKADPVHSEITFSVRQLIVRKVRGRFTSHDVTIDTSGDPLGSSVTSTIDTASIDTGNKRRDNHLRSAAVVAVEKYPTMSYRSTGIQQTDDGWVINGALTLHGVTRQVPLAVEVNGFAPDPDRGQRAGFSATAQINRRDFGIHIPLEARGVANRRQGVDQPRDRGRPPRVTTAAETNDSDRSGRWRNDSELRGAAGFILSPTSTTTRCANSTRTWRI